MTTPESSQQANGIAEWNALPYRVKRGLWYHALAPGSVTDCAMHFARRGVIAMADGDECDRHVMLPTTLLIEPVLYNLSGASMSTKKPTTKRDHACAVLTSHKTRLAKATLMGLDVTPLLDDLAVITAENIAMTMRAGFREMYGVSSDWNSQFT